MPKVLIVSAEDLTPLLGRTMLWGSDVERVFVSTPSAAFEVSRAFAPGLVVVQSSDPHTAADLIRQLREHQGTRRSSIVVVFPSSAVGEGPDLLSMGANLTLRGPIDPASWDAHFERLLMVSHRLRIRVPVRFQPSGAQTGETVAAEALDISVAGMLIETQAPLPQGTTLDLRFTVPGAPSELCARGVVVRSSFGAPARLGIRFLSLEGDARERIEALLASTPLLERAFGRYEVLGLVGEGSMGRVYRAFDPAAQRIVAIKTLKPEQLATTEAEDALRRFSREARASAQLVHPNIITIFDVGEDYFVMELLEGETLQSLLRRRSHLAPEEVCWILEPVASALDYAHGMGTVHRDIKPANIMITASGRPMVTDFGVAHLASGEMTPSGQFLGSPAYMAPEQITRGEVTGSADVFSLAVVAYEALTGRKPFEGESITPILYKLVNTDPPPPSSVNPALSPSYDEVFRRALAKGPSERFGSAGAFVRALRLGRLEAEALPLKPASTADALVETVDLRKAAGPRPRSRRRWAAAGFTIAVALIAAVVALRVSRPRVTVESPPPGFMIATEPAGAAVLLDGRSVGKSPLFVTDLPRGDHAVRIEHPGFVPAQLSVEVTGEGPPLPLRFTLQALMGTLRVESDPAPAKVRVDDRPVGATPLTEAGVSPGTHRLHVERPGYRPWVQAVDVKAGETQHVKARLDPGTDKGRLEKTLRRSGWVIAGDLIELGPGDTPPRRIAGEPAPYPEAAQRPRLKGTVTVELTVSETGTVADAHVVESAGEILDQALLEAVRLWRYEPAERSGVKVRVRIRASQAFERP